MIPMHGSNLRSLHSVLQRFGVNYLPLPDKTLFATFLAIWYNNNTETVSVRRRKGNSGMLEKSFADIYTKFKLSLYSKVFNQGIDGKDALSATEVLCVELIYAMGRPTINEFASFAGFSAPNAAYKVGNLVKKGYVIKSQSTEDKREFYLEVTDKYMETYGVTYDYIGTVMKRIRDRFPPEQVQELEEILGVVNQELMPEVNLKERP